MEVRAIARYKRISPQKVRLVIDQVKGRLVEPGLNSLSFMPQKAAGILEKIVRSAVANAEEKGLDVDDLYIKNIYVDQGPMLKRFRPRARGRATRILKKTSHITVILAEKAA
ncbi:MAG: 50S ribosomal protein L22 [Deltaproteobacteria bacterium]|nr:MAG: 50S ribosomal protein L22 [Deltaproteobacteria bacterium]PIE75283.1 MAG: 50S ribosomal protein L22 [Deltaproteobacteria bacterium]